MGGKGAVARDSSSAWGGLIVSNQEEYLFPDCTFRSEDQDLSIPDSATTSGKGRTISHCEWRGIRGAVGHIGALSHQYSASKGRSVRSGTPSGGRGSQSPVVSVTVLDVR